MSAATCCAVYIESSAVPLVASWALSPVAASAPALFRALVTGSAVMRRVRIRVSPKRSAPLPTVVDIGGDVIPSFRRRHVHSIIHSFIYLLSK